MYMVMDTEKQLRPNDTALRISWHPAFVEALQMELDAYRDVLEFHSEFQLTAEPLRIDCVVIKKAKGIAIKKNIATIFREWNLFEYKSPNDYVSVADFYKVYGYACLYASFERIPISGLTISFVESCYPKELLEHLKNIRGFTVAESAEGIYTVKGDILPIQVINSRKLSADENLWLKSLSNKLNHVEVRRISTEIAHRGKTARIAAFIHAIAGANPKSIKEAIKMANTLTIEQVFEDVGWTAKWEARGKAEGEAKGKLEIARNFKKMGLPVSQIAEGTGLPPETIQEL
jgi:hypothetical protein